MFEKYTEKARRVIFFARYEASQFGSPYIEAEHLLLGLLREDTALVGRLSQSGLSPEALRKRIEEESPPRERISTSIDMPLSLPAKSALAAAAEESENLNHKTICTEHLLLGVLRQNGTLAARLLIEAGFEITKVRDSLRGRGERHPGRWAPPPPRSMQDYVEIHGELFSFASVREFSEYYSRKFQWEKRAWAPRDALVRRSDSKIFLYSGQNFDPEQMDLVKGGWNEDRCGICWWKLGDLNAPEHDQGYTNGQDWLCTDCYERFVKPDRPPEPQRQG